MPEFCPRMDQNFAKMQEKLKANGKLLKTHLLSVSFDPQIDTPAIMKAHAKQLGADPALWSFVTGDRDAIDTRIVRETRARTGRIIDSEQEVGGYPTAPETHAAFVEAEWDLRTMERK